MKYYTHLLAISLYLCSSPLEACTGIKLVASDGSSVHGRTVEFGQKIEANIAIVPRGYSFTGTTPNGKGRTYTSKYGYMGAIAYGKEAVLDGINEKGLSVGAFFFPGFATYSEISNTNQNKALSPLEFSNWILSQFATVEEVKIATASVVIAPTVEKGWGDTPPPFHYIVYDKTGNALVIEPIGGTLVLFENKLGVITNSPTFDWHMTNLRNFINLRTENIPPQKLDGLTLTAFGQGSGMFGLPGDFTPPSRFVRAALFSQAAIPSNNSEEAILELFHILNNFDIPPGIAREVQNGILYTDSTQFTCAHDPQQLKYYFKSYEDQTLRVIDLNQCDLQAKVVRQIQVSQTQPIINMLRQS